MKKPAATSTGTTVAEMAEDPREPYEAPRLESEELFEVLALACGKTHSVSKFQCQRFNRTS